MSDDQPGGANDVAALRDTLDSLMGVFESLTDRVEELEAGGAEKSELDVEEFPAWVEWLRMEYVLGPKVPDDWARVPGVRNELQALWAAWEASYTPERVPLRSFDALQWHDALQRVLGRIADPWLGAEHSRDARAGMNAVALQQRPVPAPSKQEAP